MALDGDEGDVDEQFFGLTPVVRAYIMPTQEGAPEI